jgi:hypothetical protein
MTPVSVACKRGARTSALGIKEMRDEILAGDQASIAGCIIDIATGSGNLPNTTPDPHLCGIAFCMSEASYEDQGNRGTI